MESVSNLLGTANAFLTENFGDLGPLLAAVAASLRPGFVC